MKKPFLMNQTIVLDLDDTLINTNFRQYEVIRSFFDLYNVKISSFQDYLDFRISNKASNVNYAEQYFCKKIDLKIYRDYFIENIEKDRFLDLDTLIVEIDLLKKLSEEYNLVLLSLRSSYIQGIKQLEKLKLKPFFNDIYFVKHNIINPKILILNNLKLQSNILSFVGDTVTDYEAARNCELPFIVVNTGLFKITEKLETYETINNYIKTKLNYDKI